MLAKCETLDVMKIPRSVRGQPGMWDANTCLAFTAYVLVSAVHFT